jgi:predicted PurR-regulated permease PerM
LLAIVAGGTIGGILGAIVGIPIVSAMDVFTRMVIAPAQRKANGVEEKLEE